MSISITQVDSSYTAETYCKTVLWKFQLPPQTPNELFYLLPLKPVVCSGRLLQTGSMLISLQRTTRVDNLARPNNVYSSICPFAIHDVVYSLSFSSLLFSLCGLSLSLSFCGPLQLSPTTATRRLMQCKRYI